MANLVSILQLNTSDIGGGAEKVALDLHHSYLKKGLSAYLAVGRKERDIPNVLWIDNDSKRNQWAQLWLKFSKSFPPVEDQLNRKKLTKIIKWIGQPKRKLKQVRGLEDFCFPATKHISSLASLPIDILHGHNLHGEYFDLRALVNLSKTMPVTLTLHDEWMLTGHCAYSLGCMRWRYGCGKCPDLTIYPAIKRDATKQNWQRKRKIYQNSILYITTPSKWLTEEVTCSMLHPTRIATIPNGIDQSIFKPGNRELVRNLLDLPSNALVVLFVATKGQVNPFKDYTTIKNALQQIQNCDQPIFLLAIGGNSSQSTLGGIHYRGIGFISDPNQLAKYYQTADIFIHAAKSDNYPLTVLEALSCGIPVIATAIGGIPEQIQEGENGFLVPPGDATAMAARIDFLLKNEEIRYCMGKRAVENARLRFNLDQQVTKYLDWYSEVIVDWKLKISQKVT